MDQLSNDGWAAFEAWFLSLRAYAFFDALVKGYHGFDLVGAAA